MANPAAAAYHIQPENILTMQKPTMRAKMMVQSVATMGNTEHLNMTPVCGKIPFPADGSSEDNTFALWTPSGKLELAITNPNLHGHFKYGDKFYVDFTRTDFEPVTEPVAEGTVPSTSEGAE